VRAEDAEIIRLLKIEETGTRPEERGGDQQFPTS
jgi:hypothetical protein